MCSVTGDTTNLCVSVENMRLLVFTIVGTYDIQFQCGKFPKAIEFTFINDIFDLKNN